MKNLKATWIGLVLFGALAGGIVLAGCSSGDEDDSTTTNTTTTKTETETD